MCWCTTNKQIDTWNLEVIPPIFFRLMVNSRTDRFKCYQAGAILKKVKPKEEMNLTNPRLNDIGKQEANTIYKQ